jgi:hypothetical protein
MKRDKKKACIMIYNSQGKEKKSLRKLIHLQII